MKKILFLLVFPAFFFSCKSSKIGASENVQLRFIDDYIIPRGLEVEGTEVGGLSGIDFYDGNIFLVSDHPGNPRFYKAELKLEKGEIDSIIFSEVIELKTKTSPFKNMHLDMEGFTYDPEIDAFFVSSEGSVNNEKDPALFSITPEGKFVDSFAIPDYFLAENEEGPRNNGVFEGLSPAFDKEGIWIATELPLKSDGPKAKLYPTKSPVRITLFDKETKQAVKQFPYMLGRVRKIPWLYFAINGVSDILEYAPEKFLVVERGFAAGHGSHGNTIRIYDVDADLATNTLKKKNLKVAFYNPAQKELVFDLKWIEKYLEKGIIDNIEGIAFGPELENGSKSIILISDNNFNSLGEQINQVILMEFKLKE